MLIQRENGYALNGINFIFFAFDYTVRLFNPIMGDINYTLFSIIWLAILIRLINFIQIRTQENE